jgi:hypothetical protein
MLVYPGTTRDRACRWVPCGRALPCLAWDQSAQKAPTYPERWEPSILKKR